ncbi:MAG: hypothetical protein JSS12_11300 [Verrucomicrobia bacterium]|nr:hypothetical protein [Verrucomicrobiota bacterium]
MFQEMLLAIEAGKLTADIAKGIKDCYNYANEILDEIEDVEQQKKLLELKLVIFEAKKRELALLEQCFKKDEEIKRLETLLDIKSILRFDEVIFRDDRDGCYCPTCYQSKEAKAVHLLKDDPDEEECWKCPVCKSFFETKNAAIRRQKRIEQFSSYSRRSSF